jgi:hypothetical protein
MKVKAIGIVGGLVSLGFLAGSVSTAGITAPTEFYRITLDSDGKRKPLYVGVTDGRLAFSDRRPDSDWNDRKDTRPDRWLVLGTKIKMSAGGGYLAHDPSGDDLRVLLSREAGEGTDWKITNRKEGEHFFRSGVIQVASGKRKGWYLDIEEYEHEGEDGQTATAFRLVLRKDVEKTKVHITQIYTYRATAK